MSRSSIVRASPSGTPFSMVEQHLRVVDAGVGEGAAAVDVAERVHAFGAGPRALVDDHVAALVGVHAGQVQVESVGVRAAAGRHQQVRPRDDPSVVQVDVDAGPVPSDARHRRPHREADALALQDRAHLGGDVGILARQHLGRRLDQRHPRAEAPEGLPQLERDVARTDHHQVFGQHLELEEPRVVEPGNVRQARR